MRDSDTMKVGDLASRALSGLDLDSLKSSDQYPEAITVSVDEPAIDAVKLAVAGLAALVVVVDSQKNIYGVLDLPWILRRINAGLQEKFRNPAEAVAAVVQDNSNFRRDFPYDSFAEHRPEMRHCPGGGGHYTTQYPCPYHVKS